MDDMDEIKFFVPPAAEAGQLPARVKLQATIGIERVIFPLFILGMLAFFVVEMLGSGKHGAGIIQTVSGLYIGYGIAGAFWLVAILILILADDFYVLDRSSRQILVHKGFRFFGAEKIFMERGQIIAIGMNCSEYRVRQGQLGWTYTPVLLSIERDNIELSSMNTNMACDKLDEYNQKARSWAAALGCYWIECPARQIFDAKLYFARNYKGQV